MATSLFQGTLPDRWKFPKYLERQLLRVFDVVGLAEPRLLIHTWETGVLTGFTSSALQHQLLRKISPRLFPFLTLCYHMKHKSSFPVCLTYQNVPGKPGMVVQENDLM